MKPCPEESEYTATVTLLPGAEEFSGQLFIVLYGESGRTSEMRLSNPYYDSTFTADSPTTLTLKGYDTGPVKSIGLRKVRGNNGLA
jgi:hypothetical protein